MGEAKRRKQLDLNYGKPKPEEIIGGKLESEWREKLRYSAHQWKQIKPYFRILDKDEDVDDSFDGVWIYKKDTGEEMISFTGRFAQERFDLMP
ncbi:MAG: hypothetical protein ACYTXC_26895 [Nostoc sp.]